MCSVQRFSPSVTDEVGTNTPVPPAPLSPSTLVPTERFHLYDPVQASLSMMTDPVLALRHIQHHGEHDQYRRPFNRTMYDAHERFCNCIAPNVCTKVGDVSQEPSDGAAGDIPLESAWLSVSLAYG